MRYPFFFYFIYETIHKRRINLGKQSDVQTNIWILYFNAMTNINKYIILSYNKMYEIEICDDLTTDGGLRELVFLLDFVYVPLILFAVTFKSWKILKINKNKICSQTIDEHSKKSIRCLECISFSCLSAILLLFYC